MRIHILQMIEADQLKVIKVFNDESAETALEFARNLNDEDKRNPNLLLFEERYFIESVDLS